VFSLNGTEHGPRGAVGGREEERRKEGGEGKGKEHDATTVCSPHHLHYHAQERSGLEPSASTRERGGKEKEKEIRKGSQGRCDQEKDAAHLFQ